MWRAQNLMSQLDDLLARGLCVLKVVLVEEKVFCFELRLSVSLSYIKLAWPMGKSGWKKFSRILNKIICS